MAKPGLWTNKHLKSNELAGVIWNEKGEMVMSKELEALERIKQYTMYPEDIEGCKIIETALKRLKKLEKAFISLSKEDEKTKKLLSKEIEKNRALEIIKNYVFLDEEGTLRFRCKDQRNLSGIIILDKEIIDLLNEVLK